MNLYRKLAERAAAGNPVRVALVGAGKFGTMFLSRARVTPGLHLLGVADLDSARAHAALARAGWEPERLTDDPARALASGATWVTEDAARLIATGGVDVVVEATGVPGAGVRHALSAIEHGRDLVMVNVEADVLVGPELARRAAAAGLVYSLAWGDQPALVCEHVDWARACGFQVVAAGKGTKYLPEYHASTPDTVWTHYGFSEQQVAGGDFNPKMFNSFLDGTKSAIEMAAIANATGLTPQLGGLGFPPAGMDDLARVCRPVAHGGALDHAGTVEVVSSLHRDGRPVERDLRWGTYVVFEADSEYVRRCFAEYGLVTDDSGRYTALFRPYHLIGLELGVSVASAALRREPTGCPTGFNADVVAVAKRDLAPGERLDGEGGYRVYGRLVPAGSEPDALPIGLADGVSLSRRVAAGEPVARSAVRGVPDAAVTALREAMTAAL